MGFYKQQLIEKAKSKSKGNKPDRRPDKAVKMETLVDAFDSTLENISEYLTDDYVIFRDLRIYRKADDSLLALIKVQAGDVDYIGFGSGDDVFDCLVNLDFRVGDRGLMEDTSKSKDKQVKKK